MRLCRGASQSSTSPVAARARPPGAPSDSGAAPAAAAPASPGAGAATSQAKVVDKKVLAESRWMRFVDIHYTVDGGATQRTWQAAERTTTAPGGGLAAWLHGMAVRVDGTCMQTMPNWRSWPCPSLAACSQHCPAHACLSSMLLPGNVSSKLLLNTLVNCSSSMH